MIFVTHSVETGTKNVCHAGPTTPQYVNMTSSVGYLASIVTAKTGQGSVNCPWIITANPGQYLNITLLDFSSTEKIPGKDANEVIHSTTCHRYATIQDKETVRKQPVCRGQGRQSTAFISVGSTVEIHIERYHSLKKSPYFLLKFEGMYFFSYI